MYDVRGVTMRLSKFNESFDKKLRSPAKDISQQTELDTNQLNSSYNDTVEKFKSPFTLVSK